MYIILDLFNLIIVQLEGWPDKLFDPLEKAPILLEACRIAFLASPSEVCPAVSFRLRIPEPRDR